MLGTVADADDAVQDAWLRLDRVDSTEVDRIGGWLTKVVIPRGMRCWLTRSARTMTVLET